MVIHGFGNTLCFLKAPGAEAMQFFWFWRYVVLKKFEDTNPPNSKIPETSKKKPQYFLFSSNKDFKRIVFLFSET